MIKRAITRVFVIALAVLITFTSIPLNEFAYASEYTGSGSGDTNTTIGEWGANWNEFKQGVRVSIVDADGNNMMQGNYTAVDIVFAKPPADAIFMTGNKFEPVRVDDKDVQIIPVGLLNVAINDAIRDSNGLHKQKELKEYRDAEGIQFLPSNYEGLPLPMIYPNGRNPLTGNGEAVKSFFIKGALGSYHGLGTSGSGGFSIDSGDIHIFSIDNPKYERLSLHEKLISKLNSDENFDIPENYYPYDDFTERPQMKWKAHASLLIRNWICLLQK